MTPTDGGEGKSPGPDARLLPGSIDDTAAMLARGGYVAPRQLAAILFLALRLRRPLFLEGEAGVGKTEIARALSGLLDRPLIRLQCHEGLDQASAVYEWNYAAQMIDIRISEVAGDTDRAALREDIFSERFLIRRPILQALSAAPGRAPVLLIDEIDRADAPFEAFLLEVLEEFQVTIPEIGTIRAREEPIVILTSNRTREIHEALKRRCLYHWVDYPDAAQETEIVQRRLPGISAALTQSVVAFMQKLRRQGLWKTPGVAETLEWLRALSELDCTRLDPGMVLDTAGVILKYQEDIAAISQSEVGRLLEEIRREAEGIDPDQTPGSGPAP